jgi:hypothetical protein
MKSRKRAEASCRTKNWIVEHDPEEKSGHEHWLTRRKESEKPNGAWAWAEENSAQERTR